VAQFQITFPCYSFLANGGIYPHPLGGGTTGSIAFLMFTDWDLAERFRDQHGLTGPALRFDFPHQILLYLDTLNHRGDCVGFNSVAFDIDVSGTRGTFIPFDEFRKNLLEPS